MSEDELKVLLQDVKDYLHISWDDEKTDKNLTGMIKRGMAHLNKIAGVSFLDYTVEDSPKSLLLDYVRYANSQALEVFEMNFQGELLSLHLEYQANVQGDSENEDTK
ncbi:hypothetical protein FDC58_18500 [Clostridium botulinum]|uniref:hypothetical protein n=3 Tax=unclassified Clostridium TaxID=2614128 RepID=UPI0013CAA968|nr:hypothetical protein [Clostridium sp. CMCC3678]NFH74545.1 hypothetical protein [Clostridium botulinum]NFJ73985.1 hypothetical protein [Clostridium botulinum]NFM09517.1 hypothetical protein [Clostridium botulinum]NFN78745.1 hypothetical protein [Clostridium botulinum]NFO73644.1 hypothetical protein [Clostridium botulinum]